MCLRKAGPCRAGYLFSPMMTQQGRWAAPRQFGCNLFLQQNPTRRYWVATTGDTSQPARSSRNRRQGHASQSPRATHEVKVRVLRLVEPHTSALFPRSAFHCLQPCTGAYPDSHLPVLLAPRGTATLSSENKTELAEWCMRKVEEEQIVFQQDPSHLSHGDTLTC